MPKTIFGETTILRSIELAPEPARVGMFQLTVEFLLPVNKNVSQPFACSLLIESDKATELVEFMQAALDASKEATKP